MSKKILVLDDDQDILEVLTFVLENTGYEVKALNNGREVLEEIRQFHPDLMLMDVMLADMDGRAICRDLKNDKTTKHLPIILISGTHNLADSLNQLEAPNDFIPKPFDIDHLIAKDEMH